MFDALRSIQRDIARTLRGRWYRPSAPIGVALVLAFIPACHKEATPSSSSKSGPSLGGELFPYFRGKEFRFVGSYLGDHVYVRPSATVHLRNDVFVADTFIVTEEFASIVRNPSTNRIAIVTDPNAIGALREADFITPPSDTLLEKALQVYMSQEAANGHIRSGRTGQWLYVDLAPDLHAIYVSTTDGAERRNAREIIPMLSVKEQRCQLYIDSRNRRFAPVNTDQLLTPQEEMVYRPIREGEMEDRIWEIIRESASP